MPTIEPTSESTRIYEFCVLYPHPLPPKDLAAVKKTVDGLFAEAQGKEVFRDEMGRHGLAYNIGGFNEGEFVIYYYELEPDKVRQIDEEMRITPNVLRHMIVKPPKGYQITSYTERYAQWQKDAAAAKEAGEKQEEDDLKKKMLKRQKSKTDKPAEVKAAPEKTRTEPKDDAKISAEIDKLIADDELEL